MALPSPDCFLGLPLDERMLAIFEAVVEGGGGGETTIYASRIGAALDGVTDDTEILQGALDGGDVHLIIDGDTVIDTLYLYSNTTITIPEGFTVKKKPAPNNGQGMFRNANFVSYPGTPIDTNISFLIAGSTIDGNRRNGGGGNAPGEGPLTGDLAYLNPGINAQQEISSIFELCGVDGFTAFGESGNDFTLHDTSGFGFGLANVQNSVVRYYTKTLELGDTVPINDGWHLFGGCVNCIVEYGSHIEANDDMVAMNSNDAHDLPLSEDMPITFHAGVVSGPIIDCHARFMHQAGGTVNRGMARFLSAEPGCYIENCSVEGLTAASPVAKPIFFHNFEIPAGLGDYRSITIKDCTFGSTAGAFIQIQDAFVRRLIVDNCTNTSAATAIVAVLNGADSICIEAEIKNCNSPLTDYAISVENQSIVNRLFRSGNTVAIGDSLGTINNVAGGAMPASEVFLSDSFTGSSGTALAGHSPEVGDAWLNDASHAYQGPPVSDIRLDGQGFTYNGLGAAGTSIFNSPTPAPGVSFSVCSTLKFLTNVAGGQAVITWFTPIPGATAVCLIYSCSLEQWLIFSTPSTAATAAYAFPAAGTEVEVRTLVLDGVNRYIISQVSLNGGVTWTSMFASLVTTLSDDATEFTPGVWYDGNVAQATGVHIGNFRVGTVDNF